MTLFLSALVLVLIGLHLGSVCLVLRRLRRAPPGRPAHAPFVTLLRPVCGLDRFDRQTLGSSFRLDYPDYEVIFCAADENDAAVPVVRRLIARHPQVRARLLIGEQRISGNPKLNNLQKGWQAAGGEWGAMADANLLLPADYLWRLVAEVQPGTVLVTSPPIGTRPEGPWAALECAFLNGNQARLQLLADEIGIGFAQGKTLFWNRAFLVAQGGLSPLGAFLAEDVASTKLVRATGQGLVLTGRPFAQPIGQRSLRAVWLRQLRWSRVRRDGFPGIFLLEPFNGGLIPLCLAGAVAGTQGVLATAALWYGAELWLGRQAGWPVGRWSLPMMMLRDLMIPILWVATFGRRGFEWRGNALAPVPSEHPAE